VVDSGAPRSLFPKEIAEQSLGLSLVTGPTMEGVEETKFPTWSASVPILGKVLRVTDHGLEEWGPEFRLDPAFAEKGSFVLGRADFFPLFTITFDPPRYGYGPAITLECN
jgi:hypothetical protein